MIKIDLHVTHYNESKIFPFVKEYWKLLPLRKIFIYDNQSTDNCLNMIKEQFKDKVQIEQFCTNNQLDEKTLMNLRNNKWKKSKGLVDFVIVCDFDECLYNENLLHDLQIMKKENCSIANTKSYIVWSKTFPEYQTNKLIHQYTDIKFTTNNRFDKKILFNPNLIQEINFGPGSHTCNPKGNIKYYNNKIKIIHVENLSPEFIIEKYESRNKRRNQEMKNKHYGNHYEKSKKQILQLFEKINTYSNYNNL